MRKLGAVLVLALALILPTAANAAPYACPSDPGFCYLDLANDGCFDPPDDTGPIDALLEAGMYEPPAGSIVCPPSVRNIELTPTTARWTVAAGSRVEIYSAKLTGRRVLVTSGDSVLIGGPTRLLSFLEVEAETDIVVEGKHKSPLDLLSTAGEIRVEPGAGVQSFLRAETLGGGDIVLDETVLKGTVDVAASGDLILRSVRAKTNHSIRFRGNNIDSTGKLAVRTTDRPTSIRFEADQEVRIERISARSGGSIRINAIDVRIGLPDASGRLKRSSLRAGTWAPSLGPQIMASGDVVLDQVTVRGPRELEIDTTGTVVTLRDCVVKNGGSSLGLTTITAGPGSTCDLTGSRFINNTPAVTCGAVTGP